MSAPTIDSIDQKRKGPPTQAEIDALNWAMGRGKLRPQRDTASAG